MVTPDGQTATTTMYSFRQGLLLDGMTVGAFLARIARVYLDYLPTSAFSFLGKHLEERRPSGIVNCFGQDPRRQTFAVQAFDDHRAEVLHQLVRLPLLKVSALLGHMPVCFLGTTGWLYADGLIPCLHVV